MSGLFLLLEVYGNTVCIDVKCLLVLANGIMHYNGKI